MMSSKLALGLTLFLGAAAAPTLADEGPATRPASTQPAGAYVCPMCHTSSDKPGKCPECGMDMKKASEADKKPHGDKPW